MHPCLTSLQIGERQNVLQTQCQSVLAPTYTWNKGRKAFATYIVIIISMLIKFAKTQLSSQTPINAGSKSRPRYSCALIF